MADLRVRADFNGYFGNILCLSHGDTCEAEDGTPVHLASGLAVTAFEEDIDDDGSPDKLLASGIVEASPSELACNGSRWVLRVDERGLRRASDSPKA